ADFAGDCFDRLVGTATFFPANHDFGGHSHRFCGVFYFFKTHTKIPSTHRRTVYEQFERARIGSEQKTGKPPSKKERRFSIRFVALGRAHSGNGSATRSEIRRKNLGGAR